MWKSGPALRLWIREDRDQKLDAEELARLGGSMREMSDVAVGGIVLSCINFRALEAKPQIEAAVGVPVVTSNSAVVEAILSRGLAS